jgi:transcriptional regulator with XRE-family HTH domain
MAAKAQQPPRVSIADALRRAIQSSGLSYNALGRLAGVNQAQVCRFMLGERDLTMQVASRLCLVLGCELVRTGDVLSEPLAEPPASNRGRADDAPPPASAHKRGQGRRVDLEPDRRAAPAKATPSKVAKGQGGAKRQKG